MDMKSNYRRQFVNKYFYLKDVNKHILLPSNALNVVDYTLVITQRYPARMEVDYSSNTTQAFLSHCIPIFPIFELENCHMYT